jgi:hypothetical protein
MERKEIPMKRRIASLVVAAALMAVSASPALGDAGAPGETFPEQPGTHVANACESVTTNPGTGVGGHSRLSPTAEAIVLSLIGDACG